LGEDGPLQQMQQSYGDIIEMGIPPCRFKGACEKFFNAKLLNGFNALDINLQNLN